MGKILRRIKIGGKDTIVLFDTGALHNFILRNPIPKMLYLSKIVPYQRHI